MANEARLNNSLYIRKTDSAGNVLMEYRSTPSAFNVDVTGRKGPTPGSITVTTAGTDIDLTELTTPGLCRIMNQDDTNYVEIGMWDPATLTFYPLMEIAPGESYTIKLSRNVQEAYSNTGTGTSAATKRLRAKANGASVNLLVEAFEK